MNNILLLITIYHYYLSDNQHILSKAFNLNDGDFRLR